MKRKIFRSRLLISLVLGMAVVLTACGSKTEPKTSEDSNTQESSEKTDNTSSEPVFGTFESETLSGEAVNQDVFAKANLTMVNIWGTFCGPCIREMPDLGELNREYADKGFQIVGMISDVDTAGDDTANEIIDSTKADYTHIISSKDLRSGLLGQVQAVPTTIFVDKDGKQVGDVYTGAREKSQWQSVIDKLLKEV